MERRKLNILCWLLIILFSAQITSRFALENPRIEHSKSLQESRGLEKITWDRDGESMEHYMTSFAKGQKGGRGSGGGTINHTPRKNHASTKDFHHIISFLLALIFCVLGFMSS